MNRKTIFVIVAFLVILGVSILFFSSSSELEEEVVEEEISERVIEESIIGVSVEGRDIKAYTYLPEGRENDDGKHLVFVGGIHGGYEWNSIVLAYEIMDYLEENPDVIPKDVKVTIIPSANPDGLYKVIGKEGRFGLSDVPTGVNTSAGRFNANGVDLNRNFDCNWKPESMWRGQVVSAGTSAFSEPEAMAIKSFVEDTNPVAMIFWHSQSNAVYGSECNDGVLEGTRTIMNLYSNASGYPAIESFDYYEITGDVEGWLASINIPAITVELSTHEDIEFEKNLAGVKSLIQYATGR